MRISTTLRRAAGIAAAAAILTSLLGSAPALAVSRAAANAGPVAAVTVSNRSGQITSRGTVNAASAAKAAAGVKRTHKALPHLRVPAPTHVSTGTKTPTIANTGVQPNVVTTPPALAAGWFGISQARDGVASYPPDPWTAVSSSYIIQSTNGMIHITDRIGTLKVAMPTWALFALTPAEADADPRIIWDAYHNRWVGVLLSYVDGLTGINAAYLNIAVSDGTDPMGSWKVTSYSYVNEALTEATLPDYPGIASSSASLMVTADEFDATETSFLGASYLTLAWADILTGNLDSPKRWEFPNIHIAHMRPSIVQGSTTAHVYVVGESADTGEVLYQDVPTPGTFVTLPVNLGPGAIPPDGLVLGGAFAPTAPRQPGGTIANAVDERMTDAVWHAGKLAFVSTFGLAGTDYNRVVVLDTTTATPTIDTDSLVGAGGTTDAYLGGVGWTTSGYLVTVFSQSSSAANPGIYAAAYSSATKAWSDIITVQVGTAPNGTNRYGDFVGVAVDPAGTDTVWAANQFPDGDGKWATALLRYSMDLAAPVTALPSQSLIAGTTLGSYTVPVKVSWPATDTGSGISSSLLDVDQFGSGFASAGLLLGPATSAVRTQYWKPSTASSLTDYSYLYRVSVADSTGNSTGFILGPKQTTYVYQQTSATYSGTWTSESKSYYSGGSAKYSAKVGAYASFKTSGRSFALVTSKASTRGKAKIYVDGVLKTTLTLKTSTSAYRSIAYVINFATTGTHTIKVVVYSGRVDIDGFAVIK